MHLPVAALSLLFGAPIDCPEDTKRVAKGQEQWCESTDLYGRRTKTGPFLRSHANGAVELEGELIDGKPNGDWRRYDEHGRLIGTAAYDFGRRIDVRSPSIARSREGASEPKIPSRPTNRSEPAEATARDGVVAAVEPVARPPKPSQFVYGPLGPGKGKATLAFGVRALRIIPMIDFMVLFGLSDRLDVEGRAASLGLASLLDVGIRYRLVGGRDASLALRGSVNTVAIFGLEGDGVWAGPMPGVTVAIGDVDWQLSVSGDVPLYVVQTYGRTGPLSVVVRTTGAIEMMMEKDVSMYLCVQVYAPVVGDGAGVLPFFGVGGSW